MCANNGVEKRLMRLISAVIFVTILTSAWWLSEWCWLPTDERVAQYHADYEHVQQRTAVGALSLWI